MTVVPTTVNVRKKMPELDDMDKILAGPRPRWGESALPTYTVLAKENAKMREAIIGAIALIETNTPGVLNVLKKGLK